MLDKAMFASRSAMCLLIICNACGLITLPMSCIRARSGRSPVITSKNARIISSTFVLKRSIGASSRSVEITSITEAQSRSASFNLIKIQRTAKEMSWFRRSTELLNHREYATACLYWILCTSATLQRSPCVKCRPWSDTQYQGAVNFLCQRANTSAVHATVACAVVLKHA